MMSSLCCLCSTHLLLISCNVSFLILIIPFLPSVKSSHCWTAFSHVEWLGTNLRWQEERTRCIYLLWHCSTHDEVITLIFLLSPAILLTSFNFLLDLFSGLFPISFDVNATYRLPFASRINWYTMHLHLKHFDRTCSKLYWRL